LPAAPSVALKEASANMPKDKHGMPTYQLKHRNRVVRTTAYSHMEGEVGAPGRLNAAGTILKYGQVRSAAADWSLYPVGTTFKIKGLPYTYVVDDYGSALVGTNTVDIFFPSLHAMNRWGTRPAEITVVHWGSWERTANLLKGRTKYAHCARMYAGVQRRFRNGEVASTSAGGDTSL
jgi:3D (Asp-Asp-Asp) domain-containing protein